MSDPQNTFPPLGGLDGDMWDPKGPDGQLADPTFECRRNIGDLATDPNVQEYVWARGGWVRGPEGIAIPANSANPGPNEEAKAVAADTSSGKDDTLPLMLLLLFS
jgi:hypothetical protein